MAGLPGWARETADRVVASDPGLNRLRMGASGAIAMASALAVEYGFATLTGASTQGTIIAMLLGTIVAMMGSMALNGTEAWPKVRTAVFFPVAIGVGLLGGTATASNTDLMLGVFVVVMFLAVFVRRFGMAFFFYGFMGWLGYFFASFLHAELSMFPSLIAAVGVGTAWILLLSLTVLRTNAHRTLRRTRRAFGARARAVLRACAVLLEESCEPGTEQRAARRQRRLQARLTRLAESALMIEGWLGDGSALPEGWSGAALRRRLLDMQLAVDTLAASSESLAEAVRAGEADRGLAESAAATIRRLARREDESAGRAALRLADAASAASDAGGAGWWPARHLADAVVELLGIARSWGSPTGVDAEEKDDSFEPAVTLMMGNLPSSAVSARDVSARGTRWNPLARLSMTTRQALQVALAGGLAILIGRLLSEQRYYWAVIAAFVMFTGTATRSETVIKGANRVVGTMVGLFVGVALAHVTAGHTFAMLAVIVLSMSLGFYLIRISYAFMIFFVTIMVSQLYSALHEFSDGLLVLRLEETAIGAAIGTVVALVFVPLSTRDTVSSTRSALLTALADLLNAVADRIDGRVSYDEDGEEQPPADLDGLARTLDDRLRQLMLVAKPMTRPLLLLRNNPRLANHRLARYSASATQARRVVAGMRRHDNPPPVTLAEATRGLADATTSLAEAIPGRGDQDASGTLANVDAVLFTQAPTAGMTVRHPVTRPLIHLQQLLREMAAPLGSVDPGRNQDGEPAHQREPETGVLRGRVSAPDGEPVAAGVLLLTGPDGKQCARARFAGGGYRIDACPAGELLAILTATGYAPVAERVSVLAGEESEVDFTVTPAAAAETRAAPPSAGNGSPALITGTVRGPAHVGPLPDVSVTLFDEGGDLLAGTVTDADGGYRLPEIPGGRYTIVAAGYPPVVASARLCPGRTYLRDVTLRRGPAGDPGSDVPRRPVRDRGTGRSSRAAR